MVNSPNKKRRMGHSTSTTTNKGQNYIVKEISGCKLVQSELRFKIEWESYDDTTWEPIQNLSHCEIFRQHINERFQSFEKEIYVYVANVKQKLKNRIRKTMHQQKGITMFDIQPFDPFEYKVELTYSRIVNKLDDKFERHLEEEIFKHHFFMIDMHQRIRNDELLDLIKKKEDIVVTIENEEDFDDPPKFDYITKNYLIDEIYVVERKDISGCNCKTCDKDTDCCPKLVKEHFVYKKDNQGRSVIGKVYSHENIFECGDLCKCGPDCLNRVTQQKKQHPLCLFKTKNRGWGVRAMENIPKGSYIIEYVGELMGQEAANARAETAYLFDCNATSRDDKQFYTIDAFLFGNLARFINHSCDPNTKIWFVNNCMGDPKNIKLCFFATQKILKGEELTLDYTGGNDRSDVVESNNCNCGAPNCRKTF